MSRREGNNQDDENGNGTRLVLLAVAAAAALFTAFAAMQSAQEAVDAVGPGIPSSNN